MANLPISGLFPGTAVSGTDLFPDVQTPGVGPVKVTAAQIKYYTSLTPTLINPIVLSTVTVGAAGSAQGSVILETTTAGNYSTTIRASNSSTATWSLTLPVNAGTNGYSLLTDGNGVTSWAIPTTTNITGGAASQLLYQTSGTTTGFVPNGTAAQVLLSNGSAAPSWGALDLSSSIACTNVLPVVRGGTGMSTVGTAGQALVSDGTNIVYGDPLQASNIIGGIANEVVYQSAPNTTSFVLPGLANQSLIVSATGVPNWDAVDLSSVSAIKNTLPISNGGTGLTSVGAVGQSIISDGTGLAFGNPYAARADNLSGGAASQIAYQTAPNTTSFIPNGTPGQILTSNGTIAPSWKSPPATSFNVGVSGSGTIVSVINSYNIVDAVGNYYTFVNTTASAITLTGAIDNYSAYPFNATATSITLQPNASVSFATVIVNSEYIITNASPMTPSVTLALNNSITLTAATSVDRYSTLNITMLTTGTTITVPQPTNTTAGRTITFINSGISFFYLAFGANKYGMPIGQTITATWNGSFWYVSNAPQLNFQTNYNGASSISMSSLITSYFGVADRVNNSYTISNNTGGVVNISMGSLVNSNQFNFYSGSTNVTIPFQAQVTIKTITPNFAYYIESMSTNNNSGTAPYFYGTVPTGAVYDPPADRPMPFTTITTSPTVNYNQSTGFTFSIAGIYAINYRAGLSQSSGGNQQLNIQLQSSLFAQTPIAQVQTTTSGITYTLQLNHTFFIPVGTVIKPTFYIGAIGAVAGGGTTAISVARISG